MFIEYPAKRGLPRRLREKHSHQHVSQMRRRTKGCCQRTSDFIRSYFSYSSIHGFSYLSKDGLTVFEKCLWFVLLTFSIFFCMHSALQSVERYYTKSTVVGLERNFYFWNTTLPGLTICPMERLNKTNLEEYCSANAIDGQHKTEFIDFIEHLANSTFVNFKNLPLHPTVDETLARLNIKPKNYMDLIYNLTYDSTFEPNLSYRIRCEDGDTSIYVRQVLTEYGLCYLANSYLGDKYSSRYFIYGEYPEHSPFEKASSTPWIRTQHGNYFGLDVRYSFTGFTSNAIDVFIHSPHEVMSIDYNIGYTESGYNFEPEMMEITTEDNFESATTVSQRKCRFQHESNLTHFPIYTKNICLQECRLNLIYKLCKCIPHFYPNRFSKAKTVCDYKQLKECFPPYTRLFLRLYHSNDVDIDDDHGHESKGKTASGAEKGVHEVECNCVQNCRDTEVVLQAKQEQTNMKNLLRNSLGSSVAAGIWPRSRLKRQVIFSFTDLLVSIGGTAGLFLGFSVLGFVEVLYFFTLRLICHLRGYKF